MNTRPKLALLPVLGVFSVALYSFSQLTLGNRNTYLCQRNLKQIGLGLMQYMRDYDERTMPCGLPYGRWQNVLEPYTKDTAIFRCPAANNYAFNRHLSGISFGDVDDWAKRPTVFDSTANWLNAADFGTSYMADGAHGLWRRGRGTNVMFLDGHVKWMQSKPKFVALKAAKAPVKPPARHKPRVAR